MMEMLAKYRLIVLLVLILWIGSTPVNGQTVGEFPAPAMNFDPIKMSGIIRYEIQDVCKKIKVSSDSPSYNFLLESLHLYHRKIDSLELSNSNLFDSLTKSLASQQPVNNDPMDFSKFRTQLDSLKKVLEPIQERSKQLELELNKNMVSFLTEKQYQKWLVYQQKSKKDQIPPMPMPMNGPPMEFLR